ncbi:FkbM family methyltransferase [Chryseolinea sp. H1M3-3]|uniref:FkbM family methyltransferase n=1 Tax=Chryseolinea sp. H1M3-3 TaxID=3034144 RepID=UPI0023EB4CBE|nr:FkbM family methyltransferase [Chryseolinea sp. H1M3-3]
MYRLKKFLLKKIKQKGYSLSKQQARNGNETNPLYYLAGFFIHNGFKGDLVQIGANDGVTNDPVRKLILDFKIPSLLVEPQLPIFKKLQTAYSAVPHVRLENCAIDNVSGNKELFYVEPVSGYPMWASGIASFDKATLLKHKRVLPGLEGNLRKINVPTFTFRQLLQKHDIQEVLILQIDTEGYDFELLKHITSSGVRPKLIQYEHKHLSFRDQSACREMLTEMGYAFLTKPEDTIAIYKDQAISS